MPTTRRPPMGFSNDISVSSEPLPKVAPTCNAMGTKPLQGDVEAKSALEPLVIVDRKTCDSSGIAGCDESRARVWRQKASRWKAVFALNPQGMAQAWERRVFEVRWRASVVPSRNEDARSRRPAAFTPSVRHETSRRFVVLGSSFPSRNPAQEVLRPTRGSLAMPSACSESLEPGRPTGCSSGRG